MSRVDGVDEAASAGRGALAGKYLKFRLADEEYGVRLLGVREIIGAMPIAPVPRAPDYLRGVINLRGKVYPVVDLRQILGMDRLVTTDQTVIIIVQLEDGAEGLTTGVLVDEVLEVVAIGAESVEPPPSIRLTGADETFIVGVGKSGRNIVFLIDLGRLISPRSVAASSSGRAPAPAALGEQPSS